MCTSLISTFRRGTWHNWVSLCLYTGPRQLSNLKPSSGCKHICAYLSVLAYWEKWTVEPEFIEFLTLLFSIRESNKRKSPWRTSLWSLLLKVACRLGNFLVIITPQEGRVTWLKRPHRVLFNIVPNQSVWNAASTLLPWIKVTGGWVILLTAEWFISIY